MNIVAFPIHQIRDENFVISEINRVNAKIQANELEIARLAHANWLLRLEREGFEEKLRG